MATILRERIFSCFFFDAIKVTTFLSKGRSKNLDQRYHNRDVKTNFGFSGTRKNSRIQNISGLLANKARKRSPLKNLLSQPLFHFILRSPYSANLDPLCPTDHPLISRNHPRFLIKFPKSFTNLSLNVKN